MCGRGSRGTSKSEEKNPRKLMTVKVRASGPRQNRECRHGEARRSNRSLKARCPCVSKRLTCGSGLGVELQTLQAAPCAGTSRPVWICRERTAKPASGSDGAPNTTKMGVEIMVPRFHIATSKPKTVHSRSSHFRRVLAAGICAAGVALTACADSARAQGRVTQANQAVRPTSPGRSRAKPRYLCPVWRRWSGG